MTAKADTLVRYAKKQQALLIGLTTMARKGMERFLWEASLRH